MRQYTSSVSTENVSKFKYQGKERDGESGYDDFGGRLFDPQIARSLQVDPMAEKYLTLSPYVSMGDNPIMFIDPNGMEIQGTKDDLVKAKKIIDQGLKDNGIENATVTVESRVEVSVDFIGTISNMLMGSSEVELQFETVNYLALSGEGWADLANGVQTTGNEWADKGLNGLADIIRSETVMNFQYTDQGAYNSSLSKIWGGGSNIGGVNAKVSPFGNSRNPNDSKIGIFFHEVVGHGHPDSKNGDENKIGGAFGGRSTSDHGGDGGYRGKGFKRPLKLKKP